MKNNNSLTEPARALTAQEIEAIGIYLYKCWIADAKIEMHRRSRNMKKNNQKNQKNLNQREKI